MLIAIFDKKMFYISMERQKIIQAPAGFKLILYRLVANALTNYAVK